MTSPGPRPERPLMLLSTEDYGRYWADGFLVLRDRLRADEIGELRVECRRLWSEATPERSDPRFQWRTRPDGSAVCDRMDPVLDISTRFGSLVADPRLTGLAEDILGGEVRLFKAKLISKWPGTEGYALHQDYSYWSFVGEVVAGAFLNLILPLDSFTAASGSTELFAGLHGCRLAPPEPQSLDVAESEVAGVEPLVLDLAPGDLALFHGLTPHRSGPNRSDHNRESLFLTYALARYGDLSVRYYAGRPAGWIDPQ